MAADLFETYAVTVVATMVLGSIYFAGQDIVSTVMLYPLAICGICVLTSIAGTFAVRLSAGGTIMGALYKGFIATGVLSLDPALPADRPRLPRPDVGAADHQHRRRLHP